MATVTGFRTPEEAALDLELPLLGTLTAGPDVDGPVAAAWPADEELRRSATRIADRLLDSPLARDGSVGVLGDVSASCRAQVSAAIAAAMAAERTTVLIDADLRAAHLSFDDRRRAQEGLVDILRYGVRSPRVVSPTLTPGLALLPVGSRTLDLEGTYGAEAVPGLFAELSRSGEILIVNGPDVPDVDAAEPLLAQVEGWILVHELGTSDPERTRGLRDRCGKAQCVGILIVTGRPAAEPEAEPQEPPERAEVVPVDTTDADELAEEALFPAPIASAEAPPPPILAEPIETRVPPVVPDIAPVTTPMSAKEPHPAPIGTVDRIESAWQDTSATPRRAARGWLWAVGLVALAVLAVVLVRGRSPSPTTGSSEPRGVVPGGVAAPSDDLVTPVPGTADESTVPLAGTEAPSPTGQAPPPAEPPAGGMETTTPGPAVATGGTSVLPTSESATPTTAAPQGGTAASPEPPAATNPAATDNVAAPANPAPLGAIVYAVHLESVKAEEGATREAARLAQQGLPTFVHRTEIPDKGTWWRVYVGPYGTRDEAAVVATDLLASGRDYAQVHKLKKDEVGR